MSRFELRSIRGYDGFESRRECTTWWVADTENCYLEVPLLAPHAVHRTLADGTKKVYSGTKKLNQITTRNKRLAEFTAARHNAKQEAWERAS